jgi:hypothetical protein
VRCDTRPVSEPEDTPGGRGPGGRLLVGALVVLGLVLAWLVAAATIPRWWAQRIGDQVGGSIVNGTLVGLGYGLVFTLLPLVVLVVGIPRCRTWTTRAVVVATAVILALPNLFTLGIVIGVGNAAHAADRTLDVEAPAFRGGTLAGALLAAAIVGFFTYLAVSGRRRGHPA